MHRYSPAHLHRGIPTEAQVPVLGSPAGHLLRITDDWLWNESQDLGSPASETISSVHGASSVFVTVWTPSRVER